MSVAQQNNFTNKIGYYIGVLHMKENLCNIPNQLILDGVGEGNVVDYSYTPVLNGNKFDFNIEEYFSINAVNSNMVLQLAVKKSAKKTKDLMDKCENTPYGFKLSEIMDNIGDISKVRNDVIGNISIPISNGWRNIAHLSMVQHAKLYDDGCRKRVKVVFKIRNVGYSSARKILFKDVLPNGVTLQDAYIKIGDRMHVNAGKNLTTIGRCVYITLPDIIRGGSIKVTLILNVNCMTCVGEGNLGCISYIAWHAFKEGNAAQTAESASYSSDGSKLGTSLGSSKEDYYVGVQAISPREGDGSSPSGSSSLGESAPVQPETPASSDPLVPEEGAVPGVSKGPESPSAPSIPSGQSPALGAGTVGQGVGGPPAQSVPLAPAAPSASSTQQPPSYATVILTSISNVKMIN